MKQILSVIIAFAMCVSLLICGCAEEKIAEETVSDTGTDSADDGFINDNLPELNYGGAAFNIMTHVNYKDDVYREKADGEVVNDALYNRNIAVEERLGIGINVESYSSDGGAAYETIIEQNIRSGDDAYDVYVQKVMEAVESSAAGYYLPWNNVEYIDLNMPWWNQSAINDLSIARSNYILSGDIFLMSVSQSSVVLFNKNLFNSNNLAYPYDSVRAGTWTWDEFTSTVKDLNADLNGDGEYNLEDDRFGYATDNYTGLQHMLYYLGGHVLAKDENDIPYLDFMTEKTVEITNRAYSLFYDMNMMLVSSWPIPETLASSFKDGRIFFFGNTIGCLSVFKDMKDEFGVLPPPKYDGQQETYLAVVDGAAEMLCLPVTNTDTAFAGAVSEALASESFRSVIPAYYETAVKYKYTRDDDSIEMLDIIKKNTRLDLGYILDVGRYGFAIMDLIVAGKNDIASFIEAKKPKAEKELNEFIDAFSAQG